MDIIRMDGGSAIVNCEVTIRVNAKHVPPEEPSQLYASGAEKRDIIDRLRNLAREIDDLLREYPLTVPDASVRSGLTDIAAVFKWRMEWDSQLANRYNSELRPKLIDLYQYGRVRGFFDQQLEECYKSSLLVRAAEIPSLLRGLAQRTA